MSLKRIFPIVFELCNIGDKVVKELVYTVNGKFLKRSIFLKIMYKGRMRT